MFTINILFTVCMDTFSMAFILDETWGYLIDIQIMSFHHLTLQVTMRFLSVVIFPDKSCTSTRKIGAVPFSMVISLSGRTFKTLGNP